MRDGLRWAAVALAGVFFSLLGLVLVLILAAGTQAQQCGTLTAGAGSGPVGGVPAADVAIFEGAAARFSLGDRGPSILAAINDVESAFGTSTLPGVHSGANSAGAAGPMQIGIGGTAGDTWDQIKVNAPGDPPGQPPNVYDEADAVYSAAHYLRLSGAPGDWPAAVLAYNHAAWYVNEVLAKAQAYYTQGLSAHGPSGAGGSSSLAAGGAGTGRPFTVAPGGGDPVGPLALIQGQPAILAATQFSDPTGAWGDDLTASPDSYAELSPGIPASKVTKQNATMLGGLPYMAPLQVINPQNGRSVILYKRDIGAGQPLSSTLAGYHYRIDLTRSAERQLGLQGSAVVQVTRLAGAATGPGPGQACTSSTVAPGQYANPLAHARNVVGQRIDMGVDYDGTGPIDAIGNAHVTFAGTHIGGGWTCSTSVNGGVVYQLTDGSDQHKYVYVTEDVTPTVKTGQTVRAGQPIATFASAGASGCIEIGWASGPGPSPIALQDGGFQDGSGCAAWRTAAGDNMSDLIHALGGPYGTCRDQPIRGHYP